CPPAHATLFPYTTLFRSTFVLDCKVDDLAPHVEFWSKALGKPVATPDDDGDGRYAVLDTDTDEPILLLQKVGHDSRIHLDIETDDIEGEVARLEKLGARKIEFCKRWWVMEAPSGHRFCVVRQQREPFGAHLNAWDWRARLVWERPWPRLAAT